MSKLIIPFNFERQNKEPLEVDYKVKTLAELNDLEVKPTTYEGQQAYCVEDSTLYIYNKLGKFEPLSNKQDITSDDLKTTDKTIVGAINEVKDSIITNYEDLTNKPSIAGVELDGNKSLSDLGITMYDDTEVKGDIGDLNTYKQNKTDDTLETTDKTIVGAINEVNGNSLGTVGFSADYKNIILNRKNGLNPYIIPISAIIHNAKLTELNDIDSTDIGNGKTLVYDSATQKHKYVDSTGTDELVKMEASTEAHYLSDLIDKSTIVNDNGTLKVKKLDGQEVTITEINYLKGLTMNVMDLVNMFSNGGVKIINTPVATYADLLTYDKSALIDGISYLIYVLADETHDGSKTTYLIDKNTATPTYFGYADSHRDFTTNPIDLANEVTGKLGASNIDVDNLWTLLTINDTYKTLTTNDEVFGTHGAKALYDELVASIGDKANATDLTTHKNDTDIHVTTSDKEKWNGYNDTINEMKTNFQGGVNTIYDSVVEKGVTPVDKSPSEIADAISKLGGDLTSIYNALTNKGLNMSGTESDDQIASIITDLMTIKSFTTRTDSTTFVFNGTKDTIKDTELLDTSSGLILEFNKEELTSVESSGYIEFAEIDKSEYNNKIKFV